MKIQELEPSTRKTAIIAADLHLLKKPGMWSGRAEIAGDDVFALQQIVNITREYEADLYLLGDILDSVINLPRPVIVVQSLLEPLIADGHRVRYIQGQHEIVVQAHYENYPWLSICRGAEHMHGCAFDFMGHKAFAMDYFPQAFEALNLACVPEETEILFLHGTAEEVMGIGFHFSMSNVPKSVKKIFAGDYHEALHHLVKDGAEIVYTGSAWMRAADEPHDKSVILVQDPFNWERVPLKSRVIMNYSQMTEEQKAGSMNADTTLPEPLQQPVVIVDMPIEQDEYVRLAQYYHLHTSGSKAADSDIQYINVGDDQTDEQILERYVDRTQYQSEFDFTMDVVQNPTGDALQRLREKLGVDTVDITAEKPIVETTEINLGADNSTEEVEVL